MRRLFSSFVYIAGIVAVAQPASAAKCQDIPLRVTIFTTTVTDATADPPTTTPSAIRSDGGGEYTTASIKVCSGTNDAVTNVSGTRRTFTFVFPNPIAGSVVEAVPAWIPGAYSGSGWINVRNLTFSKQPFATMAGATFTLSGDRSSYRLGFKGQSPDLPNAPNLDDPNHTSGDNVPFPSSPVIVYPNYPQTCGTGSMPTWLVRGASSNSPDTKLEVATLHKQASTPQNAEVHEGQYSMPFELLIEALKCFAY